MRLATQKHRHLAVETPLGEDALLLVNFRGREALSQLFEFELEMLSDDDALDPRLIVGRQIAVRVDRVDDSPRIFNGHVTSFTHAGRSERGTLYRASMAPWLWFLTQTADCRIFQHRSVPQIVEQVFAELGFDDFRLQFRETYAAREYCVQYRETDFAFVSRLLEEEGIYYYFEHADDKHTMVLADHVGGYYQLDDDEVQMRNTVGNADAGDQIISWRHRHRFTPGRFAHSDFNFKTPTANLRALERSATGLVKSSALEIFDYPGLHADRETGARHAQVRIEEIETAWDCIEGDSTYRSFAPGGTARVAAHAIAAEIGRSHVLTSVEHVATVAGSYRTGTNDASSVDMYRNRFTAMPADRLFRPARTTPRPIVEGLQTAIVVGPPGEEIWPDEYGRVKVQFHWDREGCSNEHSSCWIRASQQHAGHSWGSIDLPRIGQEVVVGFLEGNPDRPMIKGRVYNGGHRAPFDLPAAKTRSGIKSNTHKGAGFNEISMDDTAGAEQLRTHAQFNMDSVVGNNKTEDVTVDRTADVVGNDTLRIGMNATENVGVNKTVTIGTHSTEEVGEHVVIDAGTSITLQCGSAKIHMNQAGVIHIEGSFVTAAALVNAAVLSPLTEINGKTALLELGLFDFTLGGVMHVKGDKTCEVSGASLELSAAGEALLMGKPLMLGDVAPPPPAPPPPPPMKPSGDGPKGPQGPKGGAGSGAVAGELNADPVKQNSIPVDEIATEGGAPPQSPSETPSADQQATDAADEDPEFEFVPSTPIDPAPGDGAIPHAVLEDLSASQDLDVGEQPQVPEEEGWGSWISAGLDWVPGVSTAKSALEAATGYDYIAGKELSEFDRAAAVAGILPYGKVLGKVGKGAKKAIGGR